MSTLTDSYFPPPTGWKSLEALVCDIVKCSRKLAILQRFGADGERQFGVDILGYRSEHMVGVQVKNHPGKRASREEVDVAITDAEAFKPPLTHFIFATSASRNASLTAHIASLSQDRARQDKFAVEILFWDDLCHELAKHPDILRAHYPQLAGPAPLPEPKLRVVFSTGEPEITVEADWTERKHEQSHRPVERIPSSVPGRGGVVAIYPPELCYRLAKPPGTVSLGFRVENCTAQEAKNASVRIELPPEIRTVHDSAWSIAHPTDQERAIKRDKERLTISVGTLFHRPAFETAPVTFVFPRPGETYELQWYATAGNKLIEEAGILKVHVLK